MVTVHQFQELFPYNKEAAAWVDALNKFMPKYDITGLLRGSGFISQTGHECEGFTDVTENLNYSAGALTATWPKRFPPEVAKQYARQPERIANRAYANRMGNGPEESGDGWRHRGRGCIQLTGGDMYRAFAKAAGRPYETIAAYLETREGAVESACWFWTKVKNLNPVADTGDIVAMTKLVNGGTNGLADRKRLYAHARILLAA
uniref:Lytic enzyme n=1 Tax=Geobacter sp. (strain M21) TaxID=443144 RepID=C6E6S2_GEOSM